MMEDELVDFGAFGDVTDLGYVGLKLGHSLESSARQAVALEVVEVRHLMNEDVGITGESDQVFVHSGVTREHDGAVGSIEAVGEGRVRVSMGYRDGRHTDNPVFEHRDRRSRAPSEGCRH